MTTLAEIQRKVGVAPDGKWGPETAAAIAGALGIGPAKPRALRDAEAFFKEARRIPARPRFEQSQVDGINRLLTVMGEAGWSIAWTAYALATAWWETAETMQPVREAYRQSEAWRKANLRYFPHYGRGYVQLTWPDNYERADAELGLRGKLLANLDLAMDPNIAARIMVAGMAEGWFSGKSLSDYLPVERATRVQFVAARRIINGTDKAETIAAHADRFQDALTAGGWA